MILLFSFYFQNVVYIGRELPRQMFVHRLQKFMPPRRNANRPAPLFAVQIVHDGHQPGMFTPVDRIEKGNLYACSGRNVP